MISVFCNLFLGNEEDVVLSQTHTEEVFVIYSGGCLPRAGRVRRVPLAARKVETCALRFPAQRTKIRTTKKENFTSCGEATNYQGTFSGVTFRPVSELPLINADDKKKIFPANAAVQAVQAPEPWTESHGEDVPLFWQECKPIELYLALLDEFKGKAPHSRIRGPYGGLPDPRSAISWDLHQSRPHDLAAGSGGPCSMRPDLHRGLHFVRGRASQAGEAAFF